MRNVVLLGIGHTNAQVLRRWATRPLAGAQLTCISDYPVATYSGMLPGVLAHQYSPAEMEINLHGLCERAQARLLVGEVNTIERTGRQIRLADGREVNYDLLSLGIGSVPSFAGVAACDETVVAVKPMQTLIERLQQRLATVAASGVPAPIQLAVVGGGAAGIEVALCLAPTVAAILGSTPWRLAIIESHDHLLPGFPPAAQRFVERECVAREIELMRRRRVVKAEQSQVYFDQGEVRRADVVLWATRAAAPPLLQRLDLTKDANGFLATRSTLQTLDDDAIFAVGDSGTTLASPAPKAGVTAVNQGPVLWFNFQQRLAGQPLRRFQPRNRFLKLLNLGDGRALLEFREWTFQGRWCWKLKDAIDRRFLAQFR